MSVSASPGASSETARLESPTGTTRNRSSSKGSVLCFRTDVKYTFATPSGPSTWKLISTLPLSGFTMPSIQGSPKALRFKNTGSPMRACTSGEERTRCETIRKTEELTRSLLLR